MSRTRLFLLTALLLAWGAHPLWAAPAAKTKGKSLLIMKLALKAKTLSVYADNKGLYYAVATAKSRAQRLSLEQLKRQHPGLHGLLQTAVACKGCQLLMWHRSTSAPLGRRR